MFAPRRVQEGPEAAHLRPVARHGRAASARPPMTAAARALARSAADPHQGSLITPPRRDELALQDAAAVSVIAVIGIVTVVVRTAGGHEAGADRGGAPAPAATPSHGSSPAPSAEPGDRRGAADGVERVSGRLIETDLGMCR
jgi:hypothetical protein